MAIEIIPKKKDKASFKKNLYYIGVGFLSLLVLVTLVFFLLGIFFAREVPNIDNEIRRQKTKDMLELEREIHGYHEKVKNLPKIIENRKSVLPFLQVIEESTHPLVFFSEIEINTSRNEAEALGTARTIVVFDQQIKSFNENNFISSFEILSFDLEEDRTVEFPIRIFFSNF